jgi:hypothetical protein
MADDSSPNNTNPTCNVNNFTYNDEIIAEKATWIKDNEIGNENDNHTFKPIKFSKRFDLMSVCDS